MSDQKKLESVEEKEETSKNYVSQDVFHTVLDEFRNTLLGDIKEMLPHQEPVKNENSAWAKVDKEKAEKEAIALEKSEMDKEYALKEDLGKMAKSLGEDYVKLFDNAIIDKYNTDYPIKQANSEVINNFVSRIVTDEKNKSVISDTFKNDIMSYVKMPEGDRIEKARNMLIPLKTGIEKMNAEASARGSSLNGIPASSGEMTPTDYFLKRRQERLSKGKKS